MIVNMKESLIQEIQAVIEEIIAVTDYFYQQKQQDGYLALNGLLKKLIMLTEDMEQYCRTEELVFNEEQWLNSFTQAMSALEEKDEILLADLLSLEIAKQLEDVFAGLRLGEEGSYVVL